MKTSSHGEAERALHLDEGKRELAEIERRKQLYRQNRQPLPVKDRTVIVSTTALPREAP